MTEEIDRLENENAVLIKRYENLMSQFQIMIKQEQSPQKPSKQPSPVKATMSPEKEKLYKSLVKVKDEEIGILKEEMQKKDNEIDTLSFALKESEH